MVLPPLKTPNSALFQSPQKNYFKLRKPYFRPPPAPQNNISNLCKSFTKPYINHHKTLFQPPKTLFQMSKELILDCPKIIIQPQKHPISIPKKPYSNPKKLYSNPPKTLI